MQYTFIEQSENASFEAYISPNLYNRYINSPNFIIAVAVDDEKDNEVAGVGAIVAGEVTDIKEINIISDYDYIRTYEGILTTICDGLKKADFRVCTITVNDDQTEDILAETKVLLGNMGFYLDNTLDMYKADIITLNNNLKKYEGKLPKAEKVKPLRELNKLQMNELAAILKKKNVPLNEIDGVIDETSLVHLNEFDSVDGCIITSKQEGTLAVEFLYMKKDNAKAVVKLIGTCIDNAKHIFSNDDVVTAVASTNPMKKMISTIFGDKASSAENYYKVL